MKLFWSHQIHVIRKGSRSHHRGRRSRESENVVVEETGPKEVEKVMSNLRPYSHYVLTVSVFNKKGEGPHSEPLAFKTQEGGKNKVVGVDKAGKMKLDKVVGED